MMSLLVALVAAVAAAQASKLEDPCCKVCNATTVKVYSLDKLPELRCGESCINPVMYEILKQVRPNLEKANSSTPCADHGYSVYDETQTHGKEIGLPTQVDFYLPYVPGPCCRACNGNPDLKYYSIPPNPKRPMCGESCLDPAEFWKYKALEPHMKRAETATPCADHGFPYYLRTDIDGKELNFTAVVDMYMQTPPQ